MVDNTDIKTIKIPRMTLKDFLRGIEVPESEVKKNSKKGIYIFVSFDIVNSTQYKPISLKWPLLIDAFYTKSLDLMNEEGFSHWKYIGDEVLFYKKLTNVKNEKGDLIDISKFHEIPGKIFDIMSRIEGEFYSLFPDSKMLVSLKSTLWIADVDVIPNDFSNQSSYSNYLIEKQQNLFKDDIQGNTNNTIDFLGPSIDLGFRLREKARKHQIVISAEFIYLQMLIEKELFETLAIDNVNNYKIAELCELKGIWHERKYPIIFYRKDWNNDKNVFEYDEKEISFIGNTKVAEFIPKIFRDLGRNVSLDKLIDIIKSSEVEKTIPIKPPIAFHVVLILFDSQKQKILLLKKKKSSDQQDLFDFGCVHLEYGKEISESISSYYQKVVNDQKFIILENAGNPIPIATYTHQRTNGELVNGVIFTGYLESAGEEDNISLPEKYSDYKWLPIAELNSPNSIPNMFKNSKENINLAKKKVDEYNKSDKTA